MEAYSKVTRFCLICNYVSRIIDPLASRCAKFRFKPLSTAAQMGTLQRIQKLENVACSTEVLDRLVDVSGGDMRQAITMLQCSHRLNGGEEITTADVDDAAGCVPVSVVENLIAKCHSNNYENVGRHSVLCHLTLSLSISSSLDDHRVPGPKRRN